MNAKIVSMSMGVIDDLEKERLDVMLRPERTLWEQGIQLVAGVDEAGRGPLAGPVVAGAVVFPSHVFIGGVDDSKNLSSLHREYLFDKINIEALAVSTGIVSEKEIDRINILQASYLAMQKAIDGLEIAVDHLLIDGRELPDTIYPQTAIVGGDRKSFSIAAASIVAKVTRDCLMAEYDLKYPGYGFAQNKGYCTRQHVKAIRKKGYCEIHRRSFKISGWKVG